VAPPLWRRHGAFRITLMTATSWDPALYQTYADERGRPFLDLTARIRTAAPSTVVDLGCGPGNMTATLAERWPSARIIGLDSSTEMITAASARTIPGRLEFRVSSIEHWSSEGRLSGPVDVIVANASLQWVPSHPDLLPAWAETLGPGGTLAFQVPRTRSMPASDVIRAVASSPRWASRVGHVAASAGPRSLLTSVRDVAEYADLLAQLGLRVDAWETTYLHILSGPDPVLEWFSGTGLRPYLDALAVAGEPSAVAEFRAEIAAGLREVYPPAPYGTILPFPRVFVVAQRP
jgi:trans-aconitate 2-methyltransferase